MKIADLVKNKRISLREDQETFCKRFNIGRTQLSNIERGHTKVISEKMLQFVLDERLPKFFLRRCETCDGKGFFMDTEDTLPPTGGKE